MNELDLHSVPHREAPILVEHFIYENKDKLPIKIITGNSSRMRSIVIDVAKEMGYNTFEDKFTEITVY